MTEILNTPHDHYLYHLSFDIISKKENESDKVQELIQLKKDIVWEILVTIHGGIIRSDVSSTVVFESPMNFNYWDNKLNDGFANRMHFLMSEVKDYHQQDGTKYFQLLINAKPQLNDNFHRDIVQPELDNYIGVSRTRKPGSRVSAR